MDGYCGNDKCDNLGGSQLCIREYMPRRNGMLN